MPCRSFAAVLALAFTSGCLGAPTSGTGGGAADSRSFTLGDGTEVSLVRADVNAFRVDWTGRPDDQACAAGACAPLPSGRDPPPFPIMEQKDVIFWNINVTLDGTPQPGGLQPTVILQALHSSRTPCGRAGAAPACAPGTAAREPRYAENFTIYREIARAGGTFPVHLILRDVALRNGETGVRLAVTASPPDRATGISGASDWHLLGEEDALSLPPATPSG